MNRNATLSAMPITAPKPASAAAAAIASRTPLCAIAGLGQYLPENILTNETLSHTVETTDKWIVERTGIRERRCADVGEATSDLALRAATGALSDAGISASELDLILLATSTADSPVPATACHLQSKLGCHGVPAMDVSAGCSGFGYALHMAAGLVKSGMHQRVLVIGADCLTRITNYADRQSCILFGDGAGAAVLAPGGHMEVIYSNIGADGSAADMIRVQAGGSRMPASMATIDAAQHTLELRGREVFKAAVRQMSDCLRRAADALGISTSDFDLIIPHQANARIIEAVGSQVNADPNKLLIDVGEIGNTAAASIPLALTRARNAGRIQPGQLIAAVGFGAGVAWACQVLMIRDRA
jgi:3-oxoacyl-[acyl-carrier-protein] synthase-3